MPRKPKGQPISAAPGQAHGARKQQEEGQSVAPLARQPDAMQIAGEFQPPPVTPLSEPGSPDQPITSGLAQGEGPGPEDIRPPQLPQHDIDAIIAAPLLPTLQAMATVKQLSPSTVRFMRAIRAGLPVGFDMNQLLNEGDSGPR